MFALTFQLSASRAGVLVNVRLISIRDILEVNVIPSAGAIDASKLDVVTDTRYAHTPMRKSDIHPIWDYPFLPTTIVDVGGDFSLVSDIGPVISEAVCNVSAQRKNVMKSIEHRLTLRSDPLPTCQSRWLSVAWCGNLDLPNLVPRLSPLFLPLKTTPRTPFSVLKPCQ